MPARDLEAIVGEGMWTAKDVAAFLKVSTRWVQDAAARGILPHRRLPGLRKTGVRFVPDEIRAYAHGESPPTAVAKSA